MGTCSPAQVGWPLRRLATSSPRCRRHQWPANSCPPSNRPAPAVLTRARMSRERNPRAAAGCRGRDRTNTYDQEIRYDRSYPHIHSRARRLPAVRADPELGPALEGALTRRQVPLRHHHDLRRQAHPGRIPGARTPRRRPRSEEPPGQHILDLLPTAKAGGFLLLQRTPPRSRSEAVSLHLHKHSRPTRPRERSSPH